MNFKGKRLFSAALLLVCSILASFIHSVQAAVNYSEDVVIAPVSFPSQLESNRFTNFSFTVENRLDVDFTNHHLTFLSDKLIMTNASVKYSDGIEHIGEFYSQPGQESRVFFTERTDTNTYKNLPFAQNAKASYLITIKTDPGQNNDIKLGNVLSFTLAFYGTTKDGIEYTSQAPLRHQTTIVKLNSLLQPVVSPTPSAVTPTPTTNASPVPTQVTTYFSPTPSPLSNDSMVITIPPPGGNGGIPGNNGGGATGGTPIPSPTPDLGNMTEEQKKNIGDLVLEIPGGNKIEFTQPVDLSNLSNVNQLKEIVLLSENGKVLVNLDKAGGLNREAKITMKNIFFGDNFSILIDGKNATPFISDVLYDKETGILTFTAKKMGNYEVVPGGQGTAAAATSRANPILLILIGILGVTVIAAVIIFSRKGGSQPKVNKTVENEDSGDYKSSVV